MKPKVVYGDLTIKNATLLIPSASFNLPINLDYSLFSFAKIIGSCDNYEILQVKVPYSPTNSNTMEYYSRIVICKRDWLQQNSLKLNSVLRDFVSNNLEFLQKQQQVLAYNPALQIALMQNSDHIINTSKCFLKVLPMSKLKDATKQKEPFLLEVYEVIAGMISESKLYDDYALMNLMVTEHERLKLLSLRLQKALEQNSLQQEMDQKKKTIATMQQLEPLVFVNTFTPSIREMVNTPTFAHTVFLFNQKAERKIDMNNIKLEDYQRLLINQEQEKLQRLEKQHRIQQENKETYKSALLETEIMLEELPNLLQQLQNEYGIVSNTSPAKMELVEEQEPISLTKNKLIN